MKDEYHHMAVSYVLAIVCVLTFAAAVASVVRADECRDAGYDCSGGCIAMPLALAIQCADREARCLAFSRYDVNGDGRVSMRDALLVARVAVGLHPDSDCAP